MGLCHIHETVLEVLNIVKFLRSANLSKVTKIRVLDSKINFHKIAKLWREEKSCSVQIVEKFLELQKFAIEPTSEILTRVPNSSSNFSRL